MAEVRALTATSLATLTVRITSTTPSAVLGMAVAWPAGTGRAAFSALRVSDFPRNRRSRRSVRMTSMTLMSWRRTAAMSTAPLDPVPSIVKVSVPPSLPVRQVVVAGTVGARSTSVQGCADVIKRDRDMKVLVGVDADHDSTVRGDRGHAGHRRTPTSRRCERRWPVG